VPRSKVPLMIQGRWSQVTASQDLPAHHFRGSIPDAEPLPGGFQFGEASVDELEERAKAGFTRDD
jgi:hypothetical protein